MTAGALTPPNDPSRPMVTAPRGISARLAAVAIAARLDDADVVALDPGVSVG